MMVDQWQCKRVCGRCGKAHDPTDDRWKVIRGSGIYMGTVPLEDTMEIRDRLMEAEPGAAVRGIEPGDGDEIVIDGMVHPIVGLLCPDCRREVDGE